LAVFLAVLYFLCACFTQLARCFLGLCLHALTAFASFRAFVSDLSVVVFPTWRPGAFTFGVDEEPPDPLGALEVPDWLAPLSVDGPALPSG